MKSTKLSAITVRRLGHVAELIVAHSERYNQVLSTTVCDPGKCGSAGCIFGFVNGQYDIAPDKIPTDESLSKDDLALANSQVTHFHRHDFYEGLAKLRLNVELGLKIWDIDRWPAKYSDAYHRSGTRSKAAARAANRRIKRFIATNGAE